MTTAGRRRAPGEGGAYEYQTARGPRWYFKCTVTLGDGTRKPVVRRGFESRPAALKEMRDVLGRSDRGEFADAGKLTVGDWLEAWLDGVRVAPRTLAIYTDVVRGVVAPRLGKLPLKQLSSTTLNKLYRELEERGGKRGQPLAARSVALAHRVIHVALQAAVDAEPPLLLRNPAAKAKPPVVVDDGRVRAWSPAQLAAFLEWAVEHDPANAALWRFAATTGLRRGELLGLEWHDVSGAVLSVQRSARPGADGEALIGPTKNRKRRAVVLDAEAVALLKAWRARRGGLNLALVRPAAAVFADENGQRPSPNSVTLAFARAVRRCRRDLGEDALPRITLHGLRHTMITIWLMAGVPVPVVAERSGHGVQVLLGTYAHVLAGTQETAAERVAAVLRSSGVA